MNAYLGWHKQSINVCVRQGDISTMKEFFLITGSALTTVGLIILQLKLLKIHHPNAELLIDVYKILALDIKPPGIH
jgi:hypothetical protein